MPRIISRLDFSLPLSLSHPPPQKKKIRSRHTCYKTDTWSLGCVFAELLIGQPLFQGGSGVDQLVEMIKVLFFFILASLSLSPRFLALKKNDRTINSRKGWRYFKKKKKDDLKFRVGYKLICEVFYYYFFVGVVYVCLVFYFFYCCLSVGWNRY